MDLIDRIFEKYGVKKVATMLIIISSISLIIIAVLIFKTISDSNEFQKQERIRQQNIQETEIPAFEDFNKRLNERFRRSCQLGKYMKEKAEKKIIYISSMGGHLKELEKRKIEKNIEENNKEKNENEDFFEKVYYLPYGTKKNIIKYFFVFIAMIIKSIYLFIKIRTKSNCNNRNTYSCSYLLYWKIIWM